MQYALWTRPYNITTVSSTKLLADVGEALPQRVTSLNSDSSSSARQIDSFVVKPDNDTWL